MSAIYRLMNPLVSSITHFLQNNGQRVGNFSGRSIEFFQTLPSQMKQNRLIAATVFIASNILFFKLADLSEKWAKKRIERDPEELNKDQELARDVVGIGVFAGVIFSLNTVLSERAQYPLSRATKVILTIATIIVPTALNSMYALMICPFKSAKKNTAQMETSEEETPLAKNREEAEFIVELEPIAAVKTFKQEATQTEKESIEMEKGVQTDTVSSTKEQETQTDKPSTNKSVKRNLKNHK